MIDTAKHSHFSAAMRSRIQLALLPTRLRLHTWQRNHIRKAKIQFPNPKRALALAICYFALFALPMAAAFQPAYRVTVDGKTIGAVGTEAEAWQAARAVEKSVSAFSGQCALDGRIETKATFALKDEILQPKAVVSNMVQAADGMDMLAVLTINGETIGACAQATQIQQILDDTLAQYKADETDKARFTENVNVSFAAAPSDAQISMEELDKQLEGKLHVEVTHTENYMEAIPYETLWVENADMAQNTAQPIINGTEGEARIRAEVVSINGVETQRTIVSRAILSRATNAVVAVGTKNIGIGTGEMMIPLTTYRYTSGFKYRDDHWHKGVDLCTEVGSPVYAADNGIVIVSEWSDSYGNYIIIDHQNGLRTLYAHNSVLLANVGDTIEKGTQIAMSGNTGRSTGPHVHFEVHHDGNAVNPELYVALGPQTQ